MVTTTYVFLVLAVALQRLLETRLSRANEAELKALGGVEHAPGQMPIMIALHASWLVCMLLEVFVFERPVHRGLTVIALLVFCIGQALRLSAMHALGTRWTARIITLPREPSVASGVFRFLRHPNYLGVILEIAALPLVHSAWLTAIVFSLANGVLLSFRIAAEERALAASGDYDARLGDHPRLVPNLKEALRAWRKDPASVR